MTAPLLLALASLGMSLPPGTGLDRHREVVTVPAGYDPATPIPVLLGLHGFGSVPEDFAGDADYQAIADRLGIALVAVSASVERGERGSYWSGDVARDREHVFTLLEHVADRVTPKPRAVLAIGFSQGRQQRPGGTFPRGPRDSQSAGSGREAGEVGRLELLACILVMNSG